MQKECEANNCQKAMHYGIEESFVRFLEDKMTIEEHKKQRRTELKADRDKQYKLVELKLEEALGRPILDEAIKIEIGLLSHTGFEFAILYFEKHEPILIYFSGQGVLFSLNTTVDFAKYRSYTRFADALLAAEIKPTNRKTLW